MTRARVEPNAAWIAPALMAGVCATLVAAVGGTLTDLGPWYSSLVQPEWAPPREAFPAVWTAVLGMAAVAGVMAWRAARDRKASEWVIGLFALNGFLNIAWSLIFFRLQRPDWAMIEAGLLWASVLLLAIVCARHSRAAGVLLLPYLAWVTIAGLLTRAVVQLNGSFG